MPLQVGLILFNAASSAALKASWISSSALKSLIILGTHEPEGPGDRGRVTLAISVGIGNAFVFFEAIAVRSSHTGYVTSVFTMIESHLLEIAKFTASFPKPQALVSLRGRKSLASKVALPS
jgi:hypothetical protein